MFLTLHEQPLAQRVEIFSLNYFPLRGNVFLQLSQIALFAGCKRPKLAEIEKT